MIESRMESKLDTTAKERFDPGADPVGKPQSVKGRLFGIEIPTAGRDHDHPEKQLPASGNRFHIESSSRFRSHSMQLRA